MISTDKDVQFTLTITGPRGSGKTFLLNIIRAALKLHSCYYVKPLDAIGEKESIIVGRNRRSRE